MSAKESASGKTDVTEILADGAVTVAGLKTEFGVGRSVAYELMGAGLLPFTQINKRRLIPRRAIKEYLAQHLVSGAK